MTNIREFSSKAATGTYSRLHKDRLDDVHNVKDFGATGNGSTNDAPFIQAAIDWQTANGNRGVIFFPAGTYIINEPLVFNYFGPHSIIFRGVGAASKLQGNFVGFIIDRSLVQNGDPGVDIIENLFIHNANADYPTAWASSTAYTAGNRITYAAPIPASYKAVYAHTSNAASFLNDMNPKWNVDDNQTAGPSAWAASTAYVTGNRVTFGGTIYEAACNFTSGSSFANDQRILWAHDPVGCIRWNSCGAMTIRNCMINGYFGFLTYDSLFDLVISNCHMSNNGSGVVLQGSVGFCVENLGGPGLIEASSIIGYGDGIRLGGACSVNKCRFELCGNGINIGTAAAGGAYGAGGCVIMGNGFEACDVAIWARACNKSFFVCNETNGHAAAYYSGYGAGGSGPLPGTDFIDDKWSTYGFVTQFGTGNIWLNNTVLGDASTISHNGAAIWIQEDVGLVNGLPVLNTWINCTALNGGCSFTGSTTKWSISGMDKLVFSGCIPDPNVDRTFAQLTTVPTLGMVATITDAATTAVGSNVTAGGSTNNYFVWHNGTNWVRVA